MAIHQSAAKGFAASADAYERGRPDYSPEAIAHLVRELGIGPGKRVLDLAAGTGKLTREIAPTGAGIVAVEPVAEMRAKLTEALPDVETVDGTAERIPLADQSVDAVVIGQAFHWFDGVRAVAEIHRVLKPTGGLGLIWQARDPSRPWVRRLDEMIDAAAGDEPRYRTGHWRRAFDQTNLFEPLSHADFVHVQRAGHEMVVDRVGSISYVAAMDDERRLRLLDEVRALLADDPDTAGREAVELPYVAHVYWTRPRSPDASA